MALDATLTARTVPKAEQKAYLYAKLTRPGAPILPGWCRCFAIDLCRHGQLPRSCRARSTSSASASIRIRAYAVVEDKRGGSRIDLDLKDRRAQYRITVKNLHERPIQLRARPDSGGAE